ncbi:hypothetical protein GCM10011505_04340 [Tistrella bauzanensis]|uniref:Uncharacterized protein n=1 Tax=Tistrella bauzanensis TaxID=657419 RepID=A0ABQ1I847_9PROT|nr:hypothetical protein GCM10011505_04340 [Tistrella bauzanensis]
MAVAWAIPPQPAPAERLVMLRDRLQAAGAVDCGMVHEQVVYAADGVTPVRADTAGTAAAFKRRPLCPMPLRAQRLSCSHTSARQTIGDALSLMMAQTAAADGLRRQRLGDLMARFSKLDAAIGMIDHARGDAERDHARATERRLAGETGAGEALDQALAQIARGRQDFTAAIATLAALKHTVLAQIDDMLRQLPSPDGGDDQPVRIGASTQSDHAIGASQPS